VAGDTVINLLGRVDEVIAAHSPDAMFVMVGGNDAVSYLYPAVRPYYQSTKKIEGGMVTPDAFTTAYRELLQQIQVQFVQPLVGLAPTEYSLELVQLRDIYHTRTREVAQSLNIPMLDLAAEFTPHTPIQREAVNLAFIRQIGERSRHGWHDYETERQQWGYTYTFDGMHLTPAAAEQFAAKIVPFLRDQL
jgi:lysophospholipase L1-like esterase